LKPLESIEYSLRFAAGLSPWWLLLFLPLAAGAGWALYRVQFRNVRRPHAAALLALRIALLLLLVFVAFRPSLVRRRVLTYNGRVLLVVDDSESMAARDNTMPPAEALRVARRLRPQLAADAPFHRLADLLHAAEAEVAAFRRRTRALDRARDAFWDQAAASRQRIEKLFERFAAQAKSLGPLEPKPQKAFEEIRQQTDRLRGSTEPFYTGSESPPPKAFEAFRTAADGLAERLMALQAAHDLRRLADGDAALEKAVGDIRSRPRLQLLARKLRQAGGALDALAAEQFVQVVSLLSGRRVDHARFDPAKLETLPGRTEIVPRLEALVTAKSDFPLSAIVYLGDGRDLSRRNTKPLTQALLRKQVPVFAGGVGSVNEPIDLAVLRVIAPPFAARGAPVHVKVSAKTSLPQPTDVQVDLLRQVPDGPPEAVVSEAFELGADAQQVVALSFTPEQTGLFRHTVRLATAPEEAFPQRNNVMDLVLNVRRQKARVLLLDWKPRWETRFALNIFQRLGYIELNPIVVLTQAGGELERGVRKGAWPDSPEALAMYDLVVLGDLPAGLLTEQEWQALANFVTEQGKCVCFLGSPGRDPGLPASLTDALLALRPRGAAADRPAAGPAPDPNAAGEALEELRLTDAGQMHPVTGRLGRHVAPARPRRWRRARPDSQVLLAGAEGSALLSARFVGQGKVFLLTTDRLWKALNPTALSAHAEVYISLLTWAVEGGFDAGDDDAPALAADRRSFVVDRGMQLWAGGGAAGEVEALVGGEVVAEAPLQPAWPGAALRRAAFRKLPAEDLTFRLKDDPEVASGRIIGTRDDPELKRLARDNSIVAPLAAASGGAVGRFVDLERFCRRMDLKRSVRPSERAWRLWDVWTVLAILVVLLTVEWVYRKLVGLV
jgi:hypothetical protein